jgi:hypothetical protein
MRGAERAEVKAADIGAASRAADDASCQTGRGRRDCSDPIAAMLVLLLPHSLPLEAKFCDTVILERFLIDSSCRSLRAASDTCGAPILMLAQQTASSFHAAISATTPGASSM